MAVDGGSVTSASEPKRGAARRARDRWRPQQSEPAEIAADAVAEDVTAMPMPAEAPHEASPARATSPRAKSRTGVGDFARANVRILVAVALLVVGLILVILGWYGTAYTNILTEQIPYLISGGLLGVALIIVAGFIASSASLERENRELRRDLVRAISSMGSGAPAAELAGANPAADGKVYVVPGGRSYHLPGCPIVEGKKARAITLPEARKSGLGTCKLCGPD